MQSSTQDPEWQAWNQWFSESEPGIRNSAFARWSVLRQAARDLRQNMPFELFDLSQAERSLDRTDRTLDFARPYQIVVIGESGAGKSSLINALIERPILKAGAGGAVTGVATYINLMAGQPGQEERARVVYRSGEEIQELVERFEALREAQAQLPDGDPRLARKRAQIERTLMEMQAARDYLQASGLLGTARDHHPERERQVLDQLMVEHSAHQAHVAPQGAIAGIKRIEFHLVTPGQRLVNCIVIDTPGLGARVLRHEHVLRDEVLNADAVILVVNANRPEQHSDETAELIRNLLFEHYTPEQASQFATKVFLVVSKYDEIKTDEDRHRLQISLQAISTLIAPDYLQRYGRGSFEPRYFELDTRQEPQVAALRSRLSDFLSRRRLGVMLAEADVLLRQVITLAKAACDKVLRDGGVRDVVTLSPEAVTIRFVDQVCTNRLQSDQQLLREALTKLFAQLEASRDSQEHEAALRAMITAIRQTLRAKLDEALPHLIRQYRIERYDAKSGRTVSDTAIRTMLLELEQTIFQALAAEVVQQLGFHYRQIFEERLRASAIHERVREKAYGQAYIHEDLRPLEQLETEQQRIFEAHRVACHQVITYELLQVPIIESLQRFEAKVWTIVNAPDLFPRPDEPVAVPAANAGAPAPSRASGGLGNLMRRLAEPMGVEAGESSHQETIANASRRAQELIEKLFAQFGSDSAAGNLDTVRELLWRQFGLRIDYVLKTTLPYLEGMFFYELGKYHALYADLVREMMERHRIQVMVNRSPIRQLFTEQSSATIARLTRASETLGAVSKIEQTLQQT
jgi:GTPase SAR1 family protein